MLHQPDIEWGAQSQNYCIGSVRNQQIYIMLKKNPALTPDLGWVKGAKGIGESPHSSPEHLKLGGVQ